MNGMATALSVGAKDALRDDLAKVRRMLEILVLPSAVPMVEP